MNLEQESKERYPSAKVQKFGKEVTEFFTVVLCDEDNTEQMFKVKRITKYDSDGKELDVPEIKFEIDNVFMRMRIFEEINNLDLEK